MAENFSQKRSLLKTKIRFIREMGRWGCIKKDMALHFMEKSER
jgi:hypothetical protein